MLNTAQKMFDFTDISNMSYEELVAKRNYIIGFNPDNINECLEAIKQYSFALQYIKEHTPEICSLAVKQNGYALKYVKEQTPEICSLAVKQNGYALKYVKEQTKDICLAAVKQNGFALQYVKEQTPEICLEAVKENVCALQYVKDINMLCCGENDMNNNNEIKEKAIAIVELFEQLLDSKEIDIPCSDEVEQSTRYKEGNCARIYGIEYCELIDGIMNIIYEPTNSAETTNGFKSILKEAGRYNSSVVILKKVITCLEGVSFPIVLFDNNSRVVEGKKCKEQASQILKVITDEVIIGKDDLVGKLDDIYIYISYEADIMLHNYAINQSYQIKPIYDIENIRSYLILVNLIIYLNTKNDIDSDKSWSVPKGLEREK